jgi:hypothetical protein
VTFSGVDGCPTTASVSVTGCAAGVAGAFVDRLASEAEAAACGVRATAFWRTATNAPPAAAVMHAAASKPRTTGLKFIMMTP